MAKCPLKFKLYQFEGGEECDPECMWLVDVFPGAFDEGELLRVCALVLIGKDMPRTPVNKLEGE